MKGRFWIAVFIATIAFLLISIPGYPKSTVLSAESSSAQKRVKSISDDAPQVSSGQSYSVRRGDNLTSIARDFGITVKAVQSANKLKSSRIKAGQILIIPAAKGASTEKAGRPAAPSLNPQRETYLSSAAVQPSGSDTAADSDASPKRLKLKQAGFEFLGVRYRFGGSGKSGIDCSGLVKTLFSKFDIELPRSSREQFKQGQKVDRDELEIGDLVFFSSSGGKVPNHVGIYVGDDKILHAARKAKQVIVSDINKIWYKVRYLGARRVMDLWWEEPASESNE